MANHVTILHISDLHFKEEDEDKQRLRKDVLDPFISTLKGFFSGNKNKEWLPKFVVITGDVSFSGKNAEFKLAEKFLEDLRDALKGLELSRFIIVPGNHDKKLTSKQLQLIMKQDVNDKFFDLIKLQKKLISDFTSKNNFKKDFINRFHDFIEFRNKYAKPFSEHAPFNLIEDQTEGIYYLKEIEPNIAFLGLNSAWLCLSGELDYGKLELRKNSVGAMLDQIDELKKFNNKLRIVTLMHHNPSWFSWSHQYSLINKVAFLKKSIYDISTIICTGHEHSISQRPTSINNKTQIFYGGSTYSKELKETDYHGNSFSLIKVYFDKFEVESKSFIFYKIPDEKKNPWHPKDAAAFTTQDPNELLEKIERMERSNLEQKMEVDYLKYRLKVSKNRL